MTHRQAAMAVVVGGILVAVGSLLPWATAATAFGSISLAGTDGDGKITLVLGAVAALIGFLSLESTSQGMRVTALVVGAIAGLAGVVDYNGLDKRLSEAASDTVRASIGPGLYLVIVGAAVVLLGAWSMKPTAVAVEPAPHVDPPVPRSGLVGWWGRAGKDQREVVIAVVVSVALLAAAIVYRAVTR